MPTSGRSFVCPVTGAGVTVVTLLERKRMGLPAVRTFQSCSGMTACLEEAVEPIELAYTPASCPLRLNLE
jgi:hypothetical protein